MFIVTFNGAHVRVAVLTNISGLRCDLCVSTGSRFNAAYDVLGVRVCRKHLAKVIDVASKRLQGADRRVPDVGAVITLAQVRKNRARALKHDLLRALEKIGILEIPDPNLDLND